MTVIDLDCHWLDPTLARRLPVNLALSLGAVPIRRAGDEVIVAMADPRDTAAVRGLEAALGFKVRPKLASPNAIRRAQEQVYREALLAERGYRAQVRTPDASAAPSWCRASATPSSCSQWFAWLGSCCCASNSSSSWPACSSCSTRWCWLQDIRDLSRSALRRQRNRDTGGTCPPSPASPRMRSCARCIARQASCPDW